MQGFFMIIVVFYAFYWMLLPRQLRMLQKGCDGRIKLVDKLKIWSVHCQVDSKITMYKISSTCIRPENTITF